MPLARPGSDVLPLLLSLMLLSSLLLLFSLPAARATPGYFVPVANRVLRLKGGVSLSPLAVPAISQLEQQIKRVIPSDPLAPLNVTSVCSLPEPELLRILLLAVLGNFTTAAADDWGRTVSLEVSPQDGSIALASGQKDSCTVLSIVIVLLIAVQFRQYVIDERARRLPDLQPAPEKAKGKEKASSAGSKKA